MKAASPYVMYLIYHSYELSYVQIIFLGLHFQIFVIHIIPSDQNTMLHDNIKLQMAIITHSDG